MIYMVFKNSGRVEKYIIYNDLIKFLGVFNAKNHPDVKKGKKTEDEVLMDWLDTFEQHHALKVDI